MQYGNKPKNRKGGAKWRQQRNCRHFYLNNQQPNKLFSSKIPEMKNSGRIIRGNFLLFLGENADKTAVNLCSKYLSNIIAQVRDFKIFSLLM